MNMNKINYKSLKEFIEDFRARKVVVNCESKEEAEKFIIFLNTLGYNWCGGNIINVLNRWFENKNKTCFANNYDLDNTIIENDITYSHVNFYKSIGIPIIKYKEIQNLIRGEKMVKITVPQTVIKYEKIVDKSTLQECIKIVDFRNVLSKEEIIKLIGEKYGNEYLNGTCYHLDGEDWIKIINEDREHVFLNRGSVYTKEIFNERIKLMKKAGERFTKLKKKYIKELEEKIKNWEDNKIHEIKI